MKYDKFRRSDNVEDYRDPNKPVDPAAPAEGASIKDVLNLTGSQLAKDAGSQDVEKATQQKDLPDGPAPR